MFKRWILRSLAAGAVGVAALIGYLVVLHSSGNFHTVLEREVYRSGQPTAEQLQTYADEVGIKSVLNLRGADPRAGWYKQEIAQSEKLGLVHADFALSASRKVTVGEATELIALMRDLPKPLLIHCKHGSDRTGLVSALYLAAIAGQDEEVAEGQLSLYFGHFSVPYLSAAYPMDESWETFEHSLEFAQN
jgi:protein tyrosine/serine phosphatase